MEQDREREIDVSLGTTQIVFAALGMGVVSFYAVVIVLALGNPLGLTPAAGFPLPALGCILAAVLLPVSFVVKSIILRRARDRARESRRGVLDLLAPYRSAHIVSGALCEGGAMILAVTVLAAGPGHLPWLAGGLVPVLGFALHFPTREKLDAFLAESRSEGGFGASE